MVLVLPCLLPQVQRGQRGRECFAGRGGELRCCRGLRAGAGGLACLALPRPTPTPATSMPIHAPPRPVPARPGAALSRRATLRHATHGPGHGPGPAAVALATAPALVLALALVLVLALAMPLPLALALAPGPWPWPCLLRPGLFHRRLHGGDCLRLSAGRTEGPPM